MNPGNGDYPEFYPFELVVDEKCGIPMQLYSDDLKDILQRVYGEGAMMIGSMDPTDPSGVSHAQDCLHFTLGSLPNLVDKSVLEIGCGQGHILMELKSRGAKCVGIEPGKQINTNLGNLELIQDYFPSRRISLRKFDVITAYNVIEHVPNLEEMFHSVGEHLTDEGDFIFCVPNCGPYLENGDISIFLHEHIRYFSYHSIVHVLELYGFEVQRVSISENEALLLVHCRKASISRNTLYNDNIFNLEVFQRKMGRVIDNLSNKLEQYEVSQVALYCPNRGLNLMSQLGFGSVRIIDDTPTFKGRYMPFFSNAIEDFSGIVERPPAAIFIASYTHADRITRRINDSQVLQSVDTFSIKDLY